MTGDTTPMSYDSCRARTRAGGQCRRPAGWGTDHVGAGPCKLHCGSTPSVSQSYRDQLVAQEARSTLERLGIPERLGNPVEELLAIGAEARAWLGVLRARVSELDELDINDKIGRQQERALVALYERALDRTSRVLTDLVRLDLDSRLVRLQENQVAMMFEALNQALNQAPEEYHEPIRLALVESLKELEA